jgi:exportin-2 (importin alpha re-exporter)
MEQFESQVTAIVTQYVGAYLSVRCPLLLLSAASNSPPLEQQYAADPRTNWKSKDTAIFLLTSIASRGSTLQQGVTSTNALVDVIKFFSDHILADLQAAPGAVHPVIQADAIKFLYTFRNQVRTCASEHVRKADPFSSLAADQGAAPLGPSPPHSSPREPLLRHPHLRRHHH